MKKLLFILLIGSSSVLAQQGKIEGVVHQNDRLGTPGVYIALKQNNKIISETISDIEGNFHFSSLPAGEYSLKVKFVGKRKKVVSEVQLVPDDVLKLDILYHIRRLE